MKVDKRNIKRKKSYHHGNLRVALVEAGLALVGELGVRGFTLRDAARRAGVSHTAPYRHFTDKEALLAAIAAEGFAGLGDALEATGGRFLDQGVAYVRWAVSHPAHFRIMFGDAIASFAPYPELQVAARRAFQALLGAIALGQKSGTVRAGDAMELARACWSLTHGLAILIIEHRLPDVPSPTPPEVVEKLARSAVELLGTGIGA